MNHEVAAEFVSIRADGAPFSETITAFMGDPADAYVMVPKDIGKAIMRASALAAERLMDLDLNRQPMVFYHDIRTFTPGECRSHALYQAPAPDRQ